MEGVGDKRGSSSPQKLWRYKAGNQEASRRSAVTAVTACVIADLPCAHAPQRAVKSIHRCLPHMDLCVGGAAAAKVGTAEKGPQRVAVL